VHVHDSMLGRLARPPLKHVRWVSSASSSAASPSIHPKSPMGPRFPSPREHYRARNRTLFMYTSAIVRIPPPNFILSIPAIKAVLPVYNNTRNIICSCSTLSSVLCCNRLRRRPCDRLSTLRFRSSNTHRDRQTYQSALQRGYISCIGLDVHASAKIRHGASW
jgi:hypothetical protein